MKQLDILAEALQTKNCTVSQNEPMKHHTSFKIGGPAELFAVPHDEETLAYMLSFCHEHGIKTTIIGNGSNLLAADEGISGLVIKIGKGLDQITMEGENRILCDAGVPLSKLCSFALSQSLSGLEFAWGIPGLAGGAAFMNAGAYGGEMKDVLSGCYHLDKTGQKGALRGDELDLSYRNSAYSTNGHIVTGLVLELRKGVESDIRAAMQEYMQRRTDKQPLDLPSAGSVFKRPPGQFAGTLIESCGLKGYSVGGAQVSEKHAGFIVNTGNATCRNVLELIKFIQQEVYNRHQIMLECEVKTIA